MRNTPGTLLCLCLTLWIGAWPAEAAFQPAPPVDRDGRIGTTSADNSPDLALDAAGNLYQLIGTDGAFPGQTSAGGRDLAVSKVAPDGTVLWTTQLGTAGFDATGGTIAVTPSGVSAVVGHTNGTFPGKTYLGGIYDCYLVILDADGNQIALDQFGTSGWDEGGGVYTDGSSIFATGHTDGALPGQASSGGRDAFVRRYDLSGTLTGTTQFGTSGDDYANAVAVAPDGNVFVTGFTTGEFTSTMGANDGYVARLDSNLNFVSAVNHGTSANDNYRGIDVGADGSVVVTGSTFGAIPGQIAQGWDILIQGVDAVDLSSRWIRQFGLTSNFDNGRDVTVAADGTSYTACNTHGLEDLGVVPNLHGCIIVLDALGSDLWNDQFIGTGASLDIYGSALGADGSVWLAGQTSGTFGGSPIGGQDAIHRKYTPFAGSVVDIQDCGFVADAGGDYRLANDISGGGVCIDITAAGVVLDLNGFRITSIDDGTDAPGTAIRAGATLDPRIENLGTSEAEILVASSGGVGLDLQGTAAAVVDGGVQGIRVLLDAPGSGIAGSDTADLSIQSVSARDNVGGSTGVHLDRADRPELLDFDYQLSPGVSISTAFEATETTDARIEDLLARGSVDLTGFGFFFSGSRVEQPQGAAGENANIQGSGTVENVTFAGGGATLQGGSAAPLNLITPTFEGFTADVRFGDNVVAQDPILIQGASDAKLQVTSALTAAELRGVLYRSSFPGQDIAIGFDPGASATLDDNLTFETYSSDGLALKGSVGYFGSNLPVNADILFTEFVDSHTVRVEDPFDGQTYSLFFFPAAMTPGDKTTFVDGVEEAGCVSNADQLTVDCPGRPGTYKFGHEVASGCGVHSIPDSVVLQSENLGAAPGTTCVELASNVTYDGLGRRVYVNPGSPGAETRGFAFTGDGATVMDAIVQLLGAETVGTEIAADDVELRAVRYEYDAEGRGLRARNVQNLTVLDDTHVGVGSTGTRYPYTVDGVGNLHVARSVAVDPEYAYDFQWQLDVSDGTITDANWTGGIGVSGAGVSARLVVRHSIWDGRRRRVELGDDVRFERTRIDPADDTPIRNLATSRGAQLDDVTLYVYDERGVPLIEDNPLAPVEISERLRVVTERGDFLFGVIEFPSHIPRTPEDGLATRYAYDDRDSVRVGDNLANEPTVELRFERIATPADPQNVELHLENAGQDALQNNGCSVTSNVGDPVHLTCDRDFNTGQVTPEALHLVYCGDGVANQQVPGDACDPPGSGKCLAGCVLPLPSDQIDQRVQITSRDPLEVTLSWPDSGEGPYEIYRSSDPADVESNPANRIGLTSGTSWSDIPPAGQAYYYRVVPAP